MLLSPVLLVPHIATLLLDERRGHASPMLEALDVAREAIEARTPDAIAILDARWMSQGPFLVGAAKRFKTITDYTGFGVEVRYDCNGAPALAKAIVEAGLAAGVRAATSDRGVDSGVTVPLHFLAPARRVRVIPLSLAPASPEGCRAWGEVLHRTLAARPERVAFVVGGMLSHDEHAWKLGRDVPEAAAFDERVLDALKQGAWDALPTRDRALAGKAKPQAELRHLDVLRGFLGSDVAGKVRCYEAAPGMGAALVTFDVPAAAPTQG